MEDTHHKEGTKHGFATKVWTVSDRSDVLLFPFRCRIKEKLVHLLLVNV